MTSLADRLHRELHSAATARPRDATSYTAVLERAVQACTTEWGVAECFDLAELYLDLATEYQALRRYDDALAATGDPEVVAWPPGRNQPCWCGSGRKYKKCCAAPSAVDTEPPQ